MRWFAGLGRLVRGLWPDRNPLRRRSDRLEAAAAGLLLAGLLAGAPAAAFTAGSWAYGVGSQIERAQLAERQQVRATLLEKAPAIAAELKVPVRARWTAPDGTPRTGKIGAPSGLPAGSTVPVWTDASGRLADTPVRGDTVIGVAVLAGVWGALLVCLLLAGIWLWVRRSLRRRRMLAWEIDWRLTGPRWTSSR